jgi:hypothetical protein
MGWPHRRPVEIQAESREYLPKVRSAGPEWPVARYAGVSTQTITRLERGEQLRDRTIETLKGMFEAAGIEFIAENGGGPGVRA